MNFVIKIIIEQEKVIETPDKEIAAFADYLNNILIGTKVMTRAKKMRTDINKEAHKFIGQLPATPHKQKPIEPVEPIELDDGDETVTVTKKEWDSMVHISKEEWDSMVHLTKAEYKELTDTIAYLLKEVEVIKELRAELARYRELYGPLPPLA
jgi:PHD/YefM family antitoxin component YafN of YafNO toxin-antitoxin module